MIKKLSAFIFAFLALLAFAPSFAFASGGTFTASNATWDQSTGHITFDLSNATPDAFITSDTVRSIQIYDVTGSTRYAQSASLDATTCASWTHCDQVLTVLGTVPSSYVIHVYDTEGFSVDHPADWASNTLTLPSPTPTPTPTYSITGTVYNDDNQNGAQDTGESGYNGATVALNTGQTATTDTNGNYAFSNLTAGTYTETLAVPNGYSVTTTNPATETVSANTTQNFGIYSAPVVSAISAPTSPVQVNTSVSTSATFTDGDTTDTHNNSGTYWDWGDTTTSQGTVTEPSGSTPGSVTGSHTYTAAGVYTVKLIVTDNDGASGTSTYQYVSIYSPTSQGLFSAGQRFSSPAGAYPQNSSLTGNVTFGLAYKYQGTMPTSDRQFSMDFNAANLHFNATDVTSLVVANSMATLTGTGTITGRSGTFNFLVTGVNGGDIRIQITDSSNNVIYDTQPGDPVTATPTTSVNGQVIAHN